MNQLRDCRKIKSFYKVFSKAFLLPRVTWTGVPNEPQRRINGYFAYGLHIAVRLKLHEETVNTSHLRRLCGKSEFHSIWLVEQSKRQRSSVRQKQCASDLVRLIALIVEASNVICSANLAFLTRLDPLWRTLQSWTRTSTLLDSLLLSERCSLDYWLAHCKTAFMPLWPCRFEQVLFSIIICRHRRFVPPAHLIVSVSLCLFSGSFVVFLQKKVMVKSSQPIVLFHYQSTRSTLTFCLWTVWSELRWLQLLCSWLNSPSLLSLSELIREGLLMAAKNYEWPGK